MKPRFWEEHIILFAAYLINQNRKSSTVKSYISAIKAVLANNDIVVNENRYLLNSLTSACRLQNDTVRMKFPIQKDLLHLILKMTGQFFADKGQMYFKNLYMAIFAAAYYGLFRIGELTDSSHVVKACDVHIALNKRKLLFVLHSSKTHHFNVKPQLIKISSTYKNHSGHILSPQSLQKPGSYCPYQILRMYVNTRGRYRTPHENFFIFADHSPVKPYHVRLILRNMLQLLKIDPTNYCCHAFRAGRSIDLLKLGLSVETIKKIGRWKSNAVYNYLR